MIPTANDSWLRDIEQVISFGYDESPRDIKTREQIGIQSIFDMNYPVCYHPKRELSYVFMAAEAYWITSGSMFVNDIAPYNKHIANFSDDGYIFNGAYGPKFINQVDYVVNTLREDESSRRAVMTIWIQNPIETKDYACTVSLQFLIREGDIHTIVTMRSNDLWLGRPYDMFNFTVMTLRILTLLNKDRNKPIGLGNMIMNVGSLHLYEKDFPKCLDLLGYNSTMLPASIRVPYAATVNWKFVVDSLLACRDKVETSYLWRIRP